MAEKAQPDQAGYFIYAGRTGDNRQHVHYVLTDLKFNDGDTNARKELDTFHTDKKVFNRARIGSIYPVTLKNGGKTVSYKGDTPVAAFWQTNDDIVQWRLADGAADAIAGIEKLGKQNPLHDALEPIRKMYARTASRQSRNAILAEVIRIITS